MDEIETKVCSNKNCVHGGKPQPVTNFVKDKSKSDGCRDICKTCEKKERDRLYYQNHRDERVEHQRQYYYDNHEESLKRSKAYREEHKNEMKEYKSQYYEENKDDMLKKQKDHNDELALYDSFADKLSNYDEVQHDETNIDFLQVKCKYCGRWFNPTNLQVKNRLASINSGFINGERNFYCSDGCKKSCPSYRQRKYPKDFKQNTSREVQPELRKMVLARDNWTCQKCGKSKDDFPDLVLHCHHKYPLNEDPVGSADMDNCITFCADCHKWVHMNVPGCGYNEMKCSE